METTKLPRIVGESLYFEKVAPHRFMLTDPVMVQLSSGHPLYIPAGFVTDFGSVPRMLWAFIIPIGRHNLACLVHDYLLVKDYPRALAAKELLHFLALSKVSRFKRLTMYCLVRLYDQYKLIG